MDFLEKGWVLWFQSLFREFTLCYKIRNRFLGRVYHFSLLICYPYSSTFCHAVVLRVLLSSIKSFLTSYQVSKTKFSYIKFVKGGSRLPKTSKKNQLWIATYCTILGSFVWSWVYISNPTYNSYFTTKAWYSPLLNVQKK